MNWKFTILDRDGNSQVIDEPVGWDATKIKITRDREKHGVMIDFQYNEFRFYGTAMRLLKNEYEEYGAEGNMRLKIELNCETAEAVAYTGRFVFKGYKYNSGNDCFVTIGIEQDSDAMTLFNRFDQAVDLQTTKGFDGSTELAPYDRLPFSIVLPSKGIKLTNEAEEELKTSGKVLGVEKIVSGGFSYNVEMGHVAVAMSKTKASEIGFYIPNAISYQTVKKGVGAFLPPFDQENVFELPLSWSQKIYIWPEGTAPVINWSEGSTGFNGESISPSLDLRIKGQIKLLDATANRIAGVIAKLDDQSNITYLHIEEIYVDSPHLAKGTVLPFDFEYHNAAYVINPGDRIYALITCGHFKTDDDAENLRDAFEISFDEGSYWNMYLISYALPSLAKVFMVNEAWSRIAEAITDGKIRVLSDYFGRTDSQPYSHPQDGCGALQVISKGLFVRRQENRMDEPFVAALSLKDMWDGLNPIHNIGIGLEPDPNRPGHLVLRIEPYRYFYDDTVLMTCSNVDRIVKASEENRIYSLFKFGYQKWEAEEYNGLDEFLTKRTYRTTLATVRNQIERLSAFIASGYAWEITRRKGNEDSKDWRYDNDTFIACVTRDDREASLTLTGSFLASSFFTEDNPVDFKTGYIVEITGTVLNAGTYTIERITEIGTGGYAIYFTTPVSFESGVSITMTLLSPGFIIEQGNVGSAEQIIDPDTIYNFRISPIRIALKWLSNVMASYKKDRPDNKLVFVDGEGNYMAAGELTDDSCRLENGKLSEKEVLEKSILEAPETALPLQRTETIEFTYPMSFVQFVTLLNNSRGLIEYDTQDGEFGKGWIAEVTYRPAEGLADFLLIPKFEA